MTAQRFNATSDSRKKIDIKDYSCQKSILDLPIKSFKYREDPTQTTYIGCLAQDLLEICPEIVNIDEACFFTIQEIKLVYLLLQELKELKTQVKALGGT